LETESDAETLELTFAFQQKPMRIGSETSENERDRRHEVVPHAKINVIT
jgi:hypothetical protein